MGEFDLWTSGHGDRQRPFHCCQILVFTGIYNPRSNCIVNSFGLFMSQFYITLFDGVQNKLLSLYYTLNLYFEDINHLFHPNKHLFTV